MTLATLCRPATPWAWRWRRCRSCAAAWRRTPGMAAQPSCWRPWRPHGPLPADRLLPNSRPDSSSSSKRQRSSGSKRQCNSGSSSSRWSQEHRHPQPPAAPSTCRRLCRHQSPAARSWKRPRPRMQRPQGRRQQQPQWQPSILQQPACQPASLWTSISISSSSACGSE